MQFMQGPGHLRRVFPGLTGSPNQLSAVIAPVIEAWGTSRLQQQQNVQIGQTGNGVALGNIVSAQVPADQIWYVPFCSLLYDGTGNPGLKLYMRVPDASAGLSNLIQIANQPNAENSKAAIPQLPFYLPPLGQLQGLSITALENTRVMSLSFLYVPLALGEAIRVF